MPESAALAGAVRPLGAGGWRPRRSLEEADGGELARTLRRYAPNIVYERRSAQLPVDFRHCRAVDCANGADRATPIRESDLGLPVTAFTHVVDRRPEGGPLYLQYWLYFPESFSGGIGRGLGPVSDKWPGFHPDTRLLLIPRRWETSAP